MKSAVSANHSAVSAIPPGPRSSIPLKLLIQFRRDVLGFLTRTCQKYGDLVSLKPLHRRFYFAVHPDHARDVMVGKSEHFMKGPALRRATHVLGNGLLISEGEFHRNQRRLAQPAFHAQRVNSYAIVMTDYAVRMRDTWRFNQVIDMHDQMMQYTLAVVAKTLFDADVQSQVETIGSAMDITVRRFTRAMIPGGQLLNYLPTPGNFRFRSALRVLNALIDNFIQQRRQSGVDRGDLLSVLLRASDSEAGGGMSDTQLRHECITLFTAGHETTANALTFAWYLLARNPAADAAMCLELQTVLAGRVPTVDDLPKLIYTRAVIAEAMRLYPPVWALGREVVSDVELSGYTVPRGSVLLLSQWVTHRDERWWPDAMAFRPERWLDDAATTARPRYAYFPFGGGVRSCIGESFAWLEAILALATLAQQWSAVLIDHTPIQLHPTITLRPRHGLKMRIVKRG